MPFSAKCKTPEDLKAVIAGINTLVDEATFEATPEGLKFRGMDPSHIALIDIFLPADVFEKYECPALVRFGVRTAELGKVLKRGDKKDAMEMTLTEDGLLQVAFNGNYARAFKQKLIESTQNNTPLPKLAFAAKAIMPVTAFGGVLDDLQVSGEFAAFDAKPGRNELLLSTKGDTGEALVTLSKILSGDDGKSILEDLEVKDEAKATYSLDYFAKFIKAVAPAGGSVTVEWSQKMPMRIGVPVATSGSMHFYLAPRVQE